MVEVSARTAATIANEARIAKVREMKGCYERVQKELATVQDAANRLTQREQDAHGKLDQAKAQLAATLAAQALNEPLPCDPADARAGMTEASQELDALMAARDVLDRRELNGERALDMAQRDFADAIAALAKAYCAVQSTRVRAAARLLGEEQARYLSAAHLAELAVTRATGQQSEPIPTSGYELCQHIASQDDVGIHGEWRRLGVVPNLMPSPDLAPMDLEALIKLAK